MIEPSISRLMFILLGNTINGNIVATHVRSREQIEDILQRPSEDIHFTIFKASWVLFLQVLQLEGE